LPKAPEVGEKLKTGTAGATPVPVKGTLSGLEVALVLNCKLAVLLPTVVGVKTTFNEQEADAARLAPQVLPLVLNWPESAPVKVMLEIVRVAVPVFVSVTEWFPLEVFVVWFPKAILVGARETAEATPLPVSESVPFTVP
jgi:hypothetical protein